jgi:hypothetical protein
MADAAVSLDLGTSPFSGAGLLDSGSSLISALQGGSWVDAALAGVGLAMDVASAVMNPLGALFSAGIGWLLDHLEPLKGWLNELTGDSSLVAGGAQVWGRIAERLGQASSDLQSSIDSTLAGLKSQALDAYRALAGDAGKHLAMVQQLSAAIGAGLSMAATLVQVVHDLVRDTIADVVGFALSLVVPTPNAIASVATKVAGLATKVGTKVTSLVSSFSKLNRLFHEVGELLAKLKAVFDKVAQGGRRADDLPVAPARAGGNVKALPTREEARNLPKAERDKLKGVDLGDGRDTYGKYTGHDASSADKEAQGLAEYAADTGRHVANRQVEVTSEARGAQVRKYDGLSQRADGTYEGVEVKSGSASSKYDAPGSAQRQFDETVSVENPAIGKLDGEVIKVTSVKVVRVE